MHDITNHMKNDNLLLSHTCNPAKWNAHKKTNHHTCKTSDPLRQLDCKTDQLMNDLTITINQPYHVHYMSIFSFSFIYELSVIFTHFIHPHR